MLKQACIERKCPNKRYAAPAKVTPERMRQILVRGGGDGDSDSFIGAFDLEDTDTAAYAVAAASRKRRARGNRRTLFPKADTHTEDSICSNGAIASYDKDEYDSLCEYYLAPVKRKKEELPSGMILRHKSVSCNLLRYNNCGFRRALYKKIHRLKRCEKNNGEIHRMLKMLYDHDVSGRPGNGPRELIKQIFPETERDADDPQAAARGNMPEVVVLDDSDGPEDDHMPPINKQTGGINMSATQNEIKIKIEK